MMFVRGLAVESIAWVISDFNIILSHMTNLVNNNSISSNRKQHAVRNSLTDAIQHLTK